MYQAYSSRACPKIFNVNFTPDSLLHGVGSRHPPINFCIFEDTHSKFTVMELLMDLYIYLVVALKKAMNLQCLERIASIHFLSPYLVSFHF